MALSRKRWFIAGGSLLVLVILLASAMFLFGGTPIDLQPPYDPPENLNIPRTTPDLNLPS